MSRSEPNTDNTAPPPRTGHCIRYTYEQLATGIGAGPGVVVVVVFGSTVVVVVVPGSTVVAVVTTVVVVGSGTDGTGGATSDTGGVSGTAGKRSARVVGRQYAWAGATATTETKAAQAKKSVVTRFLKVSSGYPPVRTGGRAKKGSRPRKSGASHVPRLTSHVADFEPIGARGLPRRGIRRNPSGRSRLSGRGSSQGQDRIRAAAGSEESRIRRLRR